MTITCEACRTTYEAPEEQAGVASCPCCEHVNRPRGRVEAIAPTLPLSEASANEDDSPVRTMVFPSEGALRETGRTDVRRLRVKKRPGLKGATVGLIVIEQGQKPRHFPVIKPHLTIGRGQCDLRVRDSEVSREHCAIEVHDGVPMIKDLGSANGTLLNGHLIREHLLKDGDQIRVGSTLFNVTVSKAA